MVLDFFLSDEIKQSKFCQETTANCARVPSDYTVQKIYTPSKKNQKFTHIGDSPVVQKQLGHGFKIFRELLDGFGELDADTLFSVLCGFQSEWISQRLSQIMK